MTDQRVRVNFATGTTTGSLTDSATTITSAAFASLPQIVLAAGRIIALSLDPTGTAEIVHVTAHDTSATTVTVLRGREGSTAAAHASGITWVHSPNAADLDELASQVNVNNQTGTTYTAVLGDAGKIIEFNNASAVTFTVPPNSSVAFPVGAIIEGWQQGAGRVTVAPGAGVTIRSEGNRYSATAQYAGFLLRKRATDEWVLQGSLV